MSYTPVSNAETDAIVKKLFDRYTAHSELVVVIGCALRLSREVFDRQAAQEPESFMQIVTTAGRRGDGRIYSAEVKMKKGAQILKENPEPHLALIHGQLIQWWYDFLEDIYRWALKEHIAGRRHARGFESLKIRISLARGKTTEEAIILGAVREFHFLNSDQKFDRVLKVLGIKVKDLDETNIQLLERHILIRNILEHSAGIVEDDDLHRLNGNPLHTYDKDHILVTWKVGDCIVLSTWEVMRVVRHVAELAVQMITGQVPKWKPDTV